MNKILIIIDLIHWWKTHTKIRKKPLKGEVWVYPKQESPWPASRHKDSFDIIDVKDGWVLVQDQAYYGQGSTNGMLYKADPRALRISVFIKKHEVKK